MKKLDLAGNRYYQYEALKEIDRFCREHKIRYFLAYGTLLGAARHQGYIPWDDDTDIMMLREDYNRFMAEYPENEVYRTMQMNKSDRYIYYFGRFINKQTFKLDKGDRLPGICIDIYPLDAYPAGDVQRAKTHEYIKKMRPWIMKIHQYFHSFRRRKIYPISNLLYWINALMYKEFSKHCFQNNFNEAEYIGSFADGSLLEHKKEVFNETVYLKFEDREFPAPIGYKQFLTTRYGDYMQLPPENQRVPYHDFICYHD